MGRARILLLLAVACLAFPIAAVAAQNFGRFLTNPVLEFPLGKREAILRGELVYLDPKGLRWIAPDGMKTDGASIPLWAQPFVGSEFEQEYIRAALIHDAACDRKIMPWQAVHTVFYWALRASGVSEGKASLLFAAVYFGGPRWTTSVRESHEVGSCLSQDAIEATTLERLRQAAPAGSRIDIFGRCRGLGRLGTQVQINGTIMPPRLSDEAAERAFMAVKARIDAGEQLTPEQIAAAAGN